MDRLEALLDHPNPSIRLRAVWLALQPLKTATPVGQTDISKGDDEQFGEFVRFFMKSKAQGEPEDAGDQRVDFGSDSAANCKKWRLSGWHRLIS